MFSELEQDLSFLREEAPLALMRKEAATFLEKRDSDIRKVPPIGKEWKGQYLPSHTHPTQYAAHMRVQGPLSTPGFPSAEQL